jgi:glutathionylspermidine synthase
VRPFPKAISEFVRKLLLSRESANLTTQRSGSMQKTEGPYGEEGFIYQSVARIPNLNEAYPVIGSWLIDGVLAGIGIRESDTLVINNLSTFVPHLFE